MKQPRQFTVTPLKFFLLVLILVTPTLSQTPSVHQPSSEYLWYEAENMRGFNTTPTGEPSKILPGEICRRRRRRVGASMVRVSPPNGRRVARVNGTQRPRARTRLRENSIRTSRYRAGETTRSGCVTLTGPTAPRISSFALRTKQTRRRGSPGSRRMKCSPLLVLASPRLVSFFVMSLAARLLSTLMTKSACTGAGHSPGTALT